MHWSVLSTILGACMAKILVIEDEEALRDGVRDILADIGGYDVLLAADGRIGVELAQTKQPDLILCDVGLPKLDGYGVLTELQADPKTAVIPFIFVTARGERKDNRLGMELGADDYIVKPFNFNELLAAIQTRLTKKKTLASQYVDQMDSLRGNILMALPHELRTPLASIIGYAELIALDAFTMPREQVKLMAHTIEDAGQRLHHLIENYLIYAQLAIIEHDPHRRAQLRALHEAQPDDIIRVVAHERKANHARTIVTVLNTPNLRLPMRNDHFLKIFEELLSNALKFSPEDSAIKICTGQENNQFYFTVTNLGRGMLPEQIKQIGLYRQFERKVYEQQGSGMGLMIVRLLAELHEGNLTIESELDGETAVTVQIPL